MAQGLIEHNLFLNDLLDGLLKKNKTIPCKYFYDEKGSLLFDEICHTSEYYITRTEIKIMSHFASEMAIAIGKNALLVELGSGSGLKTQLLLDQLQDPAGFVPVDISPLRLEETTLTLSARYPHLKIQPVLADFSQPFELPYQGHRQKVVYYFPGSTIGNLTPLEAKNFINRLLDEGGNESGILLGVDLKKDRRILEAAYNDQKGMTAAFNKNLLERMNREFSAGIDLSKFKHHAFYNYVYGRIEMHLISTEKQVFYLGDIPVFLKEYESIRTEFSYKYSLENFQKLASLCHARIRAVWTDPAQLFSIQYLTRLI